jgi:hypothetical protein
MNSNPNCSRSSRGLPSRRLGLVLIFPSIPHFGFGSRKPAAATYDWSRRNVVDELPVKVKRRKAVARWLVPLNPTRAAISSNTVRETQMARKFTT